MWLVGGELSLVELQVVVAVVVVGGGGGGAHKQFIALVVAIFGVTIWLFSLRASHCSDLV